MKTKGFTLAEVLITLGIIGVTAALTLPSLINMHQEASIGPKLAKAVATFEEAATRVMVEYPDLTLQEMYDKKDGTLVANLKKFIIISNEHLKDGTKVSLEEVQTQKSISEQAGKSVVKIVVDINGKGGLNTVGVDTFNLLLTNYGVVVPQDCAAEIAKNGWVVDKDYSPASCAPSN